MSPAEIHKRAQLNRDCGLAADADMIDALADVLEVGQTICVADLTDGYTRGRLLGALSLKLARVEAINP